MIANSCFLQCLLQFVCKIQLTNKFVLNHKNFLSFLWQKVDGPGFALGETLFGTHKVQK